MPNLNLKTIQVYNKKFGLDLALDETRHNTYLKMATTMLASCPVQCSSVMDESLSQKHSHVNKETVLYSLVSTPFMVLHYIHDLK